MVVNKKTGPVPQKSINKSEYNPNTRINISFNIYLMSLDDGKGN
jgi:hypothetical protein